MTSSGRLGAFPDYLLPLLWTTLDSLLSEGATLHLPLQQAHEQGQADEEVDSNEGVQL